MVIGSHHFVFEDEGCVIKPEEQEAFDSLPVQYSHLYLAIAGELAAVICIADPLREEAADAVKALKGSWNQKDSYAHRRQRADCSSHCRTGRCG